MQIRTRRKISRRRPRKLSRRQSLSRNGGAPPRYQNRRAGIVSNKANNRAYIQERRTAKQNAIQNYNYYNDLAKELLKDPVLVNNLWDAETMDDFEKIVGRTPVASPGRVPMNVKLLTVAVLLAMMSGVDARSLGRGNRAHVRTDALEKMFDTTDPNRPDQVWEFWRTFKFDGSGGWGPDPKAPTGPPQDPDINYEQREQRRREEQFVEL